jgi:uncharacterized membrane-anchored protein
MKKWAFALAGLLCVVQIGVIGAQIWKYERILKEGEVFFFTVKPLDPYDPFRGRYVTLRFIDATRAPLQTNETMPEDLPKRGFALLEHNANRADRVTFLTFSQPLSTSYLKVDVFGVNQPKKDALMAFSLPFNRFYMREDVAPLAERVLRDKEVEVKAKLRVLKGEGVIEALFVGQTPLAEFALKRSQKPLQ